ncbi:MAG: UDP-N-acetylmuramoyl-L-alanine--D-glutamate ligase [Pseudomonadota bacterium]
MRLTAFRENRFALFGLGGSGLSTARGLVEAGADVVAFDDNPEQTEKAASAGIPVQDLREIDWLGLDALILSPGVPLTHPEPHWTVRIAEDSSVPIIGDMELYARQIRHAGVPVKTIAITGTNGKSTTTALIAHMLARAGRDVAMGGNIGTPVLDLSDPREGLFYVLECSSYQIDLAPSLKPDISVLLNLTPDHLDRHGTMEHYAAVKENLIKGVKPQGAAVIGIDDSWCRAIANRADDAGKSVIRISGHGTEGGDVSSRGTTVYDNRGHSAVGLINLQETLALRGSHNAQNAAAASAACLSVGLLVPQITDALLSFPGLAHRLEPAGRLHAIPVMNDSKGTNAEATGHALDSFDRIYWIAGGKAKSGGIDSLKEFFPKIVKAYLIGEAAAQFSETLRSVPHVIAETLDAAVMEADRDLKTANPGSVLLLSPACASFDQFKSFEARGDRFKALVSALDGFED